MSSWVHDGHEKVVEVWDGDWGRGALPRLSAPEPPVDDDGDRRGEGDCGVGGDDDDQVLELEWSVRVDS